MDDKTKPGLSMQDLLGKTVINRQHELLGHVLDLEIGLNDGRINFLELCLDAGEPPKTVHIPWSQITVGGANDSLIAPFNLPFLHSIAKHRQRSG
ncbi:MAG: PRC-barrel domain-containing protein [Gammaproteobacteria bacterium]|nr:PRC-barrel domain-containing protein [Gammaproteobacteria bacterium]